MAASCAPFLFAPRIPLITSTGRQISHTSDLIALFTDGEREFPAFPHRPYDIQLGFMRGLYGALDKGGIGFFESPTGTGA